MRAPTQAELVRQACAERGITIYELGNGAYRLHSASVDIRVTHLRFVQLSELKSVSPSDQWRAAHGRYTR